MAPPSYRSYERQRSSWLRRALGALMVLLLGLALGRASAPSQAASPGTAAPDIQSHTVSGVPVDFPHTPTGAAVAVASYQRAFADPAILHPGVLRRRIEVVAAPGYVAAMLAANSPGERRIAAGAIGEGLRQRVPTLFGAVPIGYRIESYSPARARILTWGFTLLGNATAVPPEAYFGLAHTDLVWRGGRWRIAATQAAFGPTPKVETPRGPVGGFDVMSLSRELRSYGIAP